MIRAMLVAAVCLSSIGCGDAGNTASTTGSSTSAGGGEGGGGGGGSGGTGAGQAGGETAAGGGGGSMVSSGGTGGTGAPGEPVLLAQWVEGMYPTVRVFKGDPVEDRCTIVRLAMNGLGGGDDPAYAAVARPEGWGVEYVLVTKGFDDCHDFNLAVENELAKATAAAGSVSWRGGAWPPGPLDIDVTMSFPPGEPWVPMMDSITASGLPVEQW